VLAERWQTHYNTVRPHSSLGYLPPAPAAWYKTSGRPVPCAIGEASGYADIYEAKALDQLQVHFSNAGEVKVMTIDDLASRFGHSDLIKIDVEGAELMAFRGAEKTLSHMRSPIVLFEYIPTNAAAFGSHALMELIEVLGPGNYCVSMLGHDAQPCPIDASDEDGHLTNDYVAVPAGRLPEVRVFRAGEVS